ncbi:WD40-repeat-containing domain protein [Peziza echinospora]|nr:WD40-repeat-containing domain protein [Peziza echinospora]
MHLPCSSYDARDIGQPSVMVFPTTKTATLEGHIGACHCVTYSTGGQYVLTGGSDRKINLYNPNSGALIQKYEKGHGYEVLDIACSHDNEKLASVGGDRLAFLWDVATAKTIRRFEGHGSRINCVGFNSDATVMATGSFDATVRLWDLKSNSWKPIQVLDEAKDSVTTLKVVGWEIFTGSVDGSLRTYDIRMGSICTDLIGHSITCVTVTTDTNAILLSTLDSHLRLFDKTTGACLKSYSGSHVNKDYRVRSCVGGPGDAWVLTGSEDGKIVAYDLLEGREVAAVKGQHQGKVVSGVAFHPKGRQWVSSGVDGTVCVWGST